MKTDKLIQFDYRSLGYTVHGRELSRWQSGDCGESTVQKLNSTEQENMAFKQNVL